MNEPNLDPKNASTTGDDSITAQADTEEPNKIREFREQRLAAHCELQGYQLGPDDIALALEGIREFRDR